MFKSRFHTILLSIVVIVYLVTAYNSHGYQQADEHYQIIEFAGYKLGANNVDDLAWEYEAQIRPTMQVTIGFVILKGLHKLQIEDPYTKMIVIRTLSALLAVFLISLFIKKTEQQFENERTKKFYYFFSYLFWLIPFISVRFSSETWSGLLLLLSLIVFFSNFKKKAFKAYLLGIVLGLSFLFRFQIAFSIVGFILWLFLIEKVGIKYLTKLGISFTLVLLLGVLIDFWFYDELVFTPWNYFKANIIDNIASNYGVAPWYFYIKQIVLYPSPIIGIPLLISVLIIFIKDKKNLFLWLLIPFVLFHSLVPHKETRFLNSILYLFPIILIQGYSIVQKALQNKLYIRFINLYLMAAFIVNTLGIVLMTQKPTGNGSIALTKYIHENYKNEDINLIFTPGSNPYNPWGDLPATFYEEKYLTAIKINDLCELRETMIDQTKINLLVLMKKDLEKKNCLNITPFKHFDFECQSFPEWIDYFFSLHKGHGNQYILVLYKYSEEDNAKS